MDEIEGTNTAAGLVKDGKSTKVEEAAAKADDLTTQALRFLSTASAETIGGLFVGLAACTYLILGRIGLILMGVLGGIILHATWLEKWPTEAAQREKGLDIVNRLMDMREERVRDTGKETESDASQPRFEGFRPETAGALNDLVDAIVLNYVKWWYDPILPDENSFPAASRQILTKFMLNFSTHQSKKRPADTFLDFLTNSTSIVIVFLNELTSALSLTHGSNVSVAEAVHTYLEENPESNLANVLNTKQQAKKFNMVAEDILQKFLERSAYECDPVRAFLREILAGVVLENTLKSCSKPEWINGWIVYLLEGGEPEINQVIDEGMGVTNGFADHSSDSNEGIIGNPRVANKQVAKQEEKRHKKRLSKAEEAMEEAMEEAKRLSRLIAEEDAERLRSPRIGSEIPPTPNAIAVDAKSQPPDSNDLMYNAETRSENLFTAQSFSQPQKGIQEGVLTPDEQSPLSGDKPVALVSPPAIAPFTSFDQIVPQSTPTALQSEPLAPLTRRTTISLTLHNANVIIHDESTPLDKGKIRSKPNSDYLIQIEPASSQHPGWMIVRRYPDFECLHEVLRRIAQVSGVTAFAEQHHSLPSWKEHTKASLRGELERYLRDACWYQQLAESEGMKRFLEKDKGQSVNTSQKTGFSGLGWPNPSAFESMGKGMLDVTKGVAESGKAIGGGISGVFTNLGSLGQKKPNTGGGATNIGMHTPGRSSTTTLPRTESTTALSGTRKSRVSEDSLRAAPIIQTQPAKIPPMERRPSYNSIVEDENERQPRHSSARSSMSGRRSATQSRDPSRAPSRKNTPLSSPIQGTIEELRLPPLPSEVADDYYHFEESSGTHSHADSNAPTTRTSTSTAPSQQSPGRPSLTIPRTLSMPLAQSPSRRPRRDIAPLSEQETRVAVELIFAVINELYTLSSAWNIRRTLLTAAKTFLLRPGNPSLSSIQCLIQDSIIASNISDSGIASHLRKLRANTMPTEEELKTWPQEMSMADKERLRSKARKLLVERGMPAALTGVMGKAASGEAMGSVFEVLQEEEVARGLIFALLLQAVRACH